ncbi:MAG TPA: hypothetical protein PK313_07300, partial [Myxococcota bacterium]|nr:hypothetical protein [Myxococcota bacterium]
MRARFGAFVLPAILSALLLAAWGCSGGGGPGDDPGAPTPDVPADPGGAGDPGGVDPGPVDPGRDPFEPADPGTGPDDASGDPAAPDDGLAPDDHGPTEDGVPPPDDGPADVAAPDACVCTAGACCDGCRFRDADHVCRDAAGACDVAERCTGGDADCPDDGFVDPGAPCGDPAESACDLPDACDGFGACLANPLDADVPCDDGLACNGSDFCDGFGTCDRHAGDPCEAGTTCVEGRGCLDECQWAEFLGTSTGCTFWSVFLQRSADAEAGIQHAVAVANPHDTEVTVTAYAAGDQPVATTTVGAGSVGTLTLGSDRRLAGPGISDRAYRVVASRPVGMIQINPRQDEILYHNADA